MLTPSRKQEKMVPARHGPGRRACPVSGLACGGVAGLRRRAARHCATGAPALEYPPYKASGNPQTFVG